MLGHPGPLAKSNLHQHMQLLVWVPACQNRSNTNDGVYTQLIFIPVGRGHVYKSAPQGLIPLCIHVDGAEMFTNNEFMVWSIQSVFASGANVWDAKFPVCIIPLESMRDQDVKDAANQAVAEIVSWV